MHAACKVCRYIPPSCQKAVGNSKPWGNTASYACQWGKVTLANIGAAPRYIHQKELFFKQEMKILPQEIPPPSNEAAHRTFAPRIWKQGKGVAYPKKHTQPGGM